MSPRDLVRLISHDSLERRRLGLSFAVFGIVLLCLLYLAAVLYLLPDLGLRLLLVASAGTALVLLGPKVTFPLYFATWFSYGIPLPGLPVSLNQVLGVAFLASWAVSLIRRGVRIPASPCFVLLSIFTIYGVVVSWIYAVPGSVPAYQNIAYLLSAIAVFSVYREPGELKRLLGVLLAISCAILSVGLFEFILRRDIAPQFSDYRVTEENLRINGLARNAIQFAFQATWIMPWALLLFLEGKSSSVRRWSLAGLLFLVMLALMTFNRQTPIIIGVMLAAGLILIRSPLRRRFIAVFVSGAVVFTPYFLYKVWERIAALGAGQRPDMSLMVRQDKAVTALEMVRDYPLFGIGLNNFKDIWWEYRPIGETYVLHFQKGADQFVDLGYLQILTETGIVGSVMLLLVLAFGFRAWLVGWKHARNLKSTLPRNALAAVAMGFVQLLLSMLVQDTFFIPKTFILFAFLFLVIELAKRQARIEREEAEAAVAAPA